MLTKKTSFYRFELVKGNFDTIIDAFNLVLPPYTMSYDGKYRDNIEKTFGGTHIDLAGMDNDVIKLTGTMSGKRLRKGWARNTFKEFTGVEALKHFRDNVWKYPDNPKYSNFWQDLRVKFYDIDLEDIRYIHINNVSITRDKAQPFWHNYAITITDTGPPERPQIKNILTDSLNAFKQKLQGIVNVVQEWANTVESYLLAGESLLTTSAEFSNATVSAFNDIATSLRTTITPILNAPNLIMDVVNETITNLLNTTEIIDAFILDFEDAGGITDISSGGQFTHTMEEISQNVKIFTKDLMGVRNRAAIDSVNKGTLDAATDPSASETSSVEVTSVQQVIAKPGDTFETIALDIYGDESLGPSIAEFNGLEGGFIPEGTDLKIPIYRSQNDIDGNLVISDDNNEYGVDIKLSEGGIIQVGSSGDMATVTNTDNIKQLVNNIYKIDLGSFLSDADFGFAKEALIGKGGSENSIKLVKLKVKEAAEKDPRIAVVTDVTFEIFGDQITVVGKIQLQSQLKPIEFKTVL